MADAAALTPRQKHDLFDQATSLDVADTIDLVRALADNLPLSDCARILQDAADKAERGFLEFRAQAVVALILLLGRGQ